MQPDTALVSTRNSDMKKRVLFLCTGNSARSQMAEALLRLIAGDHFEAESAGTHPAGLNPMTVEVMEEMVHLVHRPRGALHDQYIRFDTIRKFGVRRWARVSPTGEVAAFRIALAQGQNAAGRDDRGKSREP